MTQQPSHFALPSSTPTVLRTDREQVQDPDASLLSDSKGLYDALNNELPQDDKKTAVEMPIIEQMLKWMKGRSRWIPHNYNPADGLTKLKGAHLAPLLDLLKTGFYHLKTEELNLRNLLWKKMFPDIHNAKNKGRELGMISRTTQTLVSVTDSWVMCITCHISNRLTCQ